LLERPSLFYSQDHPLLLPFGLRVGRIIPCNHFLYSIR
jgi:hypothetical protein